MISYVRKNFRKIIIDALIVASLSFFGGFVVGFVLSAAGIADANIKISLIGISNVFLSILGFFIVSMRNDDRYWLHLSSVAFLAWLSGFVNLLLGYNFTSIFIGIFWIFGCMFIGGGLGLLIRKKNRS